MAETIGRNLRTARERKGMSQAEVAAAMRAAGFTTWRQTTVNKVEATERDVSAPEFRQLAALFATSMERLSWLEGEAAAVAVVEMAIAQVRQAWREASEASLSLAMALAGGRRALETARKEKCERAHETADVLEEEIASSSIESALEDGLGRFEDGDLA